MTDPGRAPTREIPSPPRQPTWSASLRPVRGFALAAAAVFAVAVVGVLAIWAMDGFANPFVDGTLDDLRAARTVGTADAVVETIEGSQTRTTDARVERVHYRWSLDGQPRTSAAYADAGRFEVGRTYGMEYLPDDPDVNRLVGSTHSLAARSLVAVITIAALATALLLIAIRRILTVRAQLRDGPSCRARVEAAAVRGRALELDLRFALDGEERTGRSRLPRSHPLADDLRRGDLSEITVIHRGGGEAPLAVTALDFVARDTGGRGR